MDFKLVSKNNVGGAVLLLLVVALSQARVFDFLFDTYLGRLFLIVAILCLSHCHKILGVVGVLFIIIMFNSNMYYEGFGNNSSSSSSSKSSTSTKSMPTSMPTSTSTSTDDSSTTSTEPNTEQIKQIITQKISDASKNNTDSSDSTDSTKKNKNSKAVEGFDILGLENNIKRGKQSNSIPVNSFMRDADSISPYESTSFLGSFSLF